MSEDIKKFKDSLKEAVKYAKGEEAKVKVETISIKTLNSMDKSIKNIDKGKVSKPVDLSDFKQGNKMKVLFYNRERERT